MFMLLRRLSALFVFVLLFSSIGLFTPAQRVAAQSACPGAVDIALVLDGSDSVGGLQGNLAAFAVNLVTRLAPSAAGTRFSVTIFNESARVVTPLTSDVVALTSGINQLIGSSGGTAIGRGLNTGFGTLPRNRGASEVIVLLTDGKETSGSFPIPVGQSIRSQGTAILSVAYNGISGADIPTLSAFSNIVFGPYDPTQLASVIETIATGVCANLPPPPPARGGCIAIPDGSVVGELLTRTEIFWRPGAISPGNILEPAPDNKTYWVLGVDETGEYYKILLSCQYVWVPVGVMAPAFSDPVWRGTPLPTRVVS